MPWLSRTLIAWGAICIAFSVGCIAEGSGNTVGHTVCASVQLVILIMNIGLLKLQKERNHAATNNQDSE